MRPHDHIGWIFAGELGFEQLAGPFLAEGAARGELLMYLAETPRPTTVARLRDHYGSRVIRIARVADIYGESGIIDADAQLEVFGAVLADALAAGFSGVRVAADNTPFVTDEARLAAWIRWEHAADRFMADNPVTGLCAFDGRRVDVNPLRHLATLHPLSSSADARPQFRMYSDGGALCLEGDVDSFAVGELPRALDALPPGTGVLIDLGTATLMSRAPLAGLRRLAGDGVAITLRGDREALEALADGPVGDGDAMIWDALPDDVPALLEAAGAPACEPGLA